MELALLEKQLLESLAHLGLVRVRG